MPSGQPNRDAARDDGDEDVDDERHLPVDVRVGNVVVFADVRLRGREERRVGGVGEALGEGLWGSRRVDHALVGSGFLFPAKARH